MRAGTRLRACVLTSLVGIDTCQYGDQVGGGADVRTAAGCSGGPTQIRAAVQPCCWGPKCVRRERCEEAAKGRLPAGCGVCICAAACCAAAGRQCTAGNETILTSGRAMRTQKVTLALRELCGPGKEGAKRVLLRLGTGAAGEREPMGPMAGMQRVPRRRTARIVLGVSRLQRAPETRSRRKGFGVSPEARAQAQRPAAPVQQPAHRC